MGFPHAQADPLALGVDVQDVDLDNLAGGEHVFGLGYMFVGYLGNVDQARKMWQEILKTVPNYEAAQKNLERYPG